MCFVMIFSRYVIVKIKLNLAKIKKKKKCQNLKLRNAIFIVVFHVIVTVRSSVMNIT
jgi:hypothetical protein